VTVPAAHAAAAAAGPELVTQDGEVLVSLRWGEDEPLLPATPITAGHVFRAAVAAVAVCVVNRVHRENGASTAAGWAGTSVLWVHLDGVDEPGHAPEVITPDALGRYCLGDGGHLDHHARRSRPAAPAHGRRLITAGSLRAADGGASPCAHPHPLAPASTPSPPP
jgi:hypothetical protein